MKKLIGLVLTLMMALPCAAVAQEADTVKTAATTANAVAECVNTYDITAPFAGVVQPFTWEKGDKVSAGDTLFALDTLKLYAPETGTVRGVFAAEGELCEDAVARYGMIASIEKDEPLMIKASTKGKYDSDENEIIHLGEAVYFEQTSDKDNEGEGRIVALNGKDYTVEITAGDFKDGDSVKIYRDEKMGTKTCIGEGKLERGADVAVTGSGRVLKSYFAQGQRVKKGQLMFEMIPADSASDLTAAQLTAAMAGVLDTPKVVSGQQVYKGQVLATLHDVSAMRVVAQVDEMDLDKAKVGDSLSIVFDRYPDSPLSGIVSSVAQMGVEKQNATYYDVKIDYTTSLETLPGMNATVYLPDGE